MISSTSRTRRNAMDGPCSNDNPDYDAGTQPCPGSTTSWEGMFDGAINPPPDDVEEEGGDYPSFYSCVASSGVELVDAAGAAPTTFRFGYEVHYAAPLPSPPDDDRGGGAAGGVDRPLRAVLGDFELRLARGVASAMGLLVDYNGEGGRGCADDDDDGGAAPASIEVAVPDVARTSGNGPSPPSSVEAGGTRGRGGGRRRRMDRSRGGGRRRRRRGREGTIATRGAVFDGPPVAGVSSLPPDVADDESRE